MKTTKTSVVTKSVLALAAVASLNAFAGTKPASAACAACDGAPFSGILSVDYASTLIFRGAALGDNALTTGLSLSIPLADGFSLAVGSSASRATSSTNNNSLSLNTYSLGLNYSVGEVKLGLVYNQYDNLVAGLPTQYSASFNEVGVTASTSAGAIDFGAGVYRDLDRDGTYAQASVGTSVEVTSSVKLVPSVVAGYGFGGYYGGVGASNDGLTNVAANLAAPIKVTKNSTLTPYASWNVTGDQRAQNQHNSQLIGGVKFSVGF